MNYKMFLDNIPESIIITDKMGQIGYMNIMANNTFGKEITNLDQLFTSDQVTQLTGMLNAVRSVIGY